MIEEEIPLTGFNTNYAFAIDMTLINKTIMTKKYQIHFQQVDFVFHSVRIMQANTILYNRTDKGLPKLWFALVQTIRFISAIYANFHVQHHWETQLLNSSKYS